MSSSDVLLLASDSPNESMRSRPTPARGESAADLLALAERVVRWEDDVPLAELEVFQRLYEDVLQHARRELGMPEHTAGVARLPHDQAQARSALLLLRVEAYRLVQCVARAKRRAAPTHRASVRRYVLGAFVLLALSAALARNTIVDGLDLGNIGRGRPWRASSRLNESYAQTGTLHSVASPFFFHTAQEASPWIEVDLGTDTQVGSLVVHNRVNCCANRAVPLVVETSHDHNAWQVVATRQRSFSVWRPRVGVNTRWVRLRVLRESILHLRALVIRS